MFQCGVGTIASAADSHTVTAYSGLGDAYPDLWQEAAAVASRVVLGAPRQNLVGLVR